jgi:hypothetical protein
MLMDAIRNSMSDHPDDELGKYFMVEITVDGKPLEHDINLDGDYTEPHFPYWIFEPDNGYDVEDEEYITHEEYDEFITQFQNQLRNKMKISKDRLLIMPMGLYQASVKASYIRKKVEVVVKVLKDIPVERLKKVNKSNRGEFRKPNLPNESQEINEDEKQAGKIRMLFRTKEQLDDNAGEVVFDDINSMVKFIESVGGDYSTEIADGFTQGKLMTIDLKTPVIQLAI